MRFWQEDQGLELTKFSSKSLDITTLPETVVFSINRYLGDIWLLPGEICKKHLKSQPQHIVFPSI